MNAYNLLLPSFENPSVVKRKAEWDLMDCDKPIHLERRHPHQIAYSPDWENGVPGLIAKLVSDVAEKKKLELRFNLLEILAGELLARVNKLESAKSLIIAINTFAPEPYVLLKPILVSVHSVGGDFEAGWLDANIHSGGDNEEEAVSNLKSLILDYFDSFSKEPSEKLGPEPTRQFAVMKQFIQK